MYTRLHTGWWGNAEPIHISEIPLDKPQESSLENKRHGIIRNINFSNITIEGESGMIFYGYHQHALKDIQLNDIRFHFKDSQYSKSYGSNFDLRPAFDDQYYLVSFNSKPFSQTPLLPD